MTTRPGMREGFALPAALLALIVVGGLVTAGAYAAMTEDRSSVNADFGQKAFTAAERGLQDVLGTKTRPYFEDEVGGVGESDMIGPVDITVGDVDARYTVTVKRLATRLFLVESEGEILTGGKYAGATRRVAQLMRIHYTYLPTDRAVTTQQPLTIRGQSGISGQDAMPTGWVDPYCSDEGLAKGVVSDNIDDVTVTGAGGITGNPEEYQDDNLTPESFEQYGDMKLSDLKAYADIVLTPSGSNYGGIGPLTTVDDECDYSDELNWGDPNDPTGVCHYYFPVIHVPGDLHVSNGAGQGILIVDGDLHVTGSFEFTGIMFVYGSFTGTGNGNKVTGSLNIAGLSGTDSDIGKPSGGSGQGNTQLQLSSCAIERAHRFNDRFARPIILAERSFVDMSGIGVQ